MSYRDRIKEARKAAGLTQGQLGDLIGKAKSTVANYERESGNEPDIATLADIMRVLHVDANYIFQDEAAAYGSGISVSERSLITKYRGLTEHSKTTIDALVEVLYERDNPDEFVPHIAAPQKSGSVDKIK